MCYNQLVSSIPKHWKTIIQEQNPHLLAPPRIDLKIIKSTTKPTKYISEFLKNEINITHISKYLMTWEKKLETNINWEDYSLAFKSNKKFVKTDKLFEFQYRLLLNKIFTNDVLFQWGKVNSPSVIYVPNQNKL